jgi:hypothetical protein
MIRLAADENFHNTIVRVLLRRCPKLDIIRIQDVGLGGAHDTTILEWAASEDRILLTHDAATIPYYAFERTRVGKRMPGVIEVSRRIPARLVIEELLILVECSNEGEWEGQVLYLPL